MRTNLNLNLHTVRPQFLHPDGREQRFVVRTPFAEVADEFRPGGVGVEGGEVRVDGVDLGPASNWGGVC